MWSKRFIPQSLSPPLLLGFQVGFCRLFLNNAVSFLSPQAKDWQMYLNEGGLIKIVGNREKKHSLSPSKVFCRFELFRWTSREQQGRSDLGSSNVLKCLWRRWLRYRYTCVVCLFGACCQQFHKVKPRVLFFGNCFSHGTICLFGWENQLWLWIQTA